MALDDEIEKLFNDFGLKFTDDLRTELIRKGVTGTGGQESSLAGSIKPITSSGADGVSLEIIIDAKSKEGKAYWRYVDEGRRGGKRPPMQAIKEWIKQKGISPKELKSTNSVKKKVKQSFDKRVTTLAFMIARKIGSKGTIKRFGYKGADFLDPILKDGRTVELQKEISALLKKDIVLNIKAYRKEDGTN